MRADLCQNREPSASRPLSAIALVAVHLSAHMSFFASHTGRRAVEDNRRQMNDRGLLLASLYHPAQIWANTHMGRLSCGKSLGSDCEKILLWSALRHSRPSRGRASGKTRIQKETGGGWQRLSAREAGMLASYSLGTLTASLHAIRR